MLADDTSLRSYDPDIPELNTKFQHNNNNNNDFISIALFHVKHAQLR